MNSTLLVWKSFDQFCSNFTSTAKMRLFIAVFVILLSLQGEFARAEGRREHYVGGQQNLNSELVARQMITRCPDDTPCFSNGTCCPALGEGYFCCPFANAGCCPSLGACCPSGQECNESPESLEDICTDGATTATPGTKLVILLSVMLCCLVFAI